LLTCSHATGTDDEAADGAVPRRCGGGNLCGRIYIRNGIFQTNLKLGVLASTCLTACGFDAAVICDQTDFTGKSIFARQYL
jgi:hypothetical protein